MNKRTEHTSQKTACGAVWFGPTPGDHYGTRLRHLCRAHVVETGECLCACGARTLATDEAPAIAGAVTHGHAATQ